MRAPSRSPSSLPIRVAQSEIRSTIEVEGEGGTIAFKNSFIHDCLSALGHQEKEITLELQSYSKMGVFKSYDKVNYLYLIMPMRV